MSTTQPHLENGIPGAKPFQIFRIPMSADPIHIPHIKDLVRMHPSFLKRKARGHRINWNIYFKMGTNARDDLTEILLASGVLSLEPFENLRICDGGFHERFLGPVLDGDNLFFHRDMLAHAQEFKLRKEQDLAAKGKMPSRGIELVQMTSPPSYAVIFAGNPLQCPR